MNTDQLKKNIQTGWEQVRLGDVSHIFSGGTPDTSNKDFWNGKISWITPTEITKTGKYIQSETEKKITETGLKNSSAKLLPKGSLIVCTRATVGECSISTYPISTNQGFKNLVPKKDTTVDYLYYFIKSIKPRLMKLGSGSTFLEVSKGDIENLAFNLPPLPEQNRIVAVLETWDKAIELLKKKIELKKEMKRGLMQELLMGKARLPGFKEDWKTVELQEVCSVSMGQSPSSLAYNDSGMGIPLVQGNLDIKNRKTIARIWTTEVTKSAKTGDIIMTVRAPVGLIGVASSDICIGRGVCAIRASSAEQDYMLKFLENYEKRWKAFEQGSTFTAVNSADVKGLLMSIPTSRTEQIAIARILSAASKEVEILEGKLRALQEQKRYLLNNLIIGQIRTPENLKIFS